MLVQGFHASRYILNHFCWCQQLFRCLLIRRLLHHITLHFWHRRIVVFYRAHGGYSTESFYFMNRFLSFSEPAEMATQSTLFVFMRNHSQRTSNLLLAFRHYWLQRLQLLPIITSVPLLCLLRLYERSHIPVLYGAVEVVLSEYVFVLVDGAVQGTSVSEVRVSLGSDLVVQCCCQPLYLLLIFELLSHHAVTMQLLDRVCCMIDSFEIDFLAHH